MLHNDFASAFREAVHNRQLLVVFTVCTSAEVLQDLAHDLVKGQYADKERAVAMLSSMTMYIDHHQVLLESGVLPALMSAVSNPKVEPTVSSPGLPVGKHATHSSQSMTLVMHSTTSLQALSGCL